MVDEKLVEKLVREKLEEKMFLVGIAVSSSNKINVFIDSFEGLTIDQCVKISRHVEHSLDRDQEDFELQVSSPGLTERFVVKEQYLKNISRELEVVVNEGQTFKGELKSADDEKILLESRSREKVEGHKKKQLVIKEHELKYDEIKTAKVVISFK